MQELDAGVRRRELPVHGRTQTVAGLHPDRDRGSPLCLAGKAPIQALRHQGSELDLGDAGRLSCLVV